MTDGPPTPGQITIERHGDARIVSFYGEHDVSTATLVWERLSDARVRAGRQAAVPAVRFSWPPPTVARFGLVAVGAR